MWVLVYDSDPERAYSLLPSTEYTVGRIKCDIGDLKDVSLSRRHAKITVKPPPPSSSSNRPPSVILEDLGSSYGTYLGEGAIATSGKNSQEDKMQAGPREMSDGERVRFGLRDTLFKLCWRPLVCTASSLSKGEKNSLMEKLGGIEGTRFLNSWSDGVTHVVMTEITLTVKVINALAKAIPIVTPAFFTDYLSCVQTKQLLPLHKNYLPRLAEKSLNQSEVSCAVKPSRRHLFQGKTFLFAAARQRTNYEDAIRYAGGKILTYGIDAVSPRKVDDSFVVVVPSQTNSDSGFRAITSWMKKQGLSLIPEQNIGLAIVKNSCEIDCNPRRKVVLRSSLPMVQESQQQILASPTQSLLMPEVGMTGVLTPTQPFPSSGTQRRIPETLTGPSRTSSTTANDKFAAPSIPVIRAPSQETITVLQCKQEVNSREAAGSEEEEEDLFNEKRGKAASKLSSKRARKRSGSESTSMPPPSKIVKTEMMSEKENNSSVQINEDVAAVVEVVSRRNGARSEVNREEEEDLFAFTEDPTSESCDTNAPSQSSAVISSPGDANRQLSRKTRGQHPSQQQSQQEPPPSLPPSMFERSVVSESSSSSKKRPREQEECGGGVKAGKRQNTPLPSTSAVAAGPSREVSLTSERGFVNKSMIKDRSIVAPPIAATDDNDDDAIPPEDLARSFCQLQVARLLRPRPLVPTYVTSDREEDLNRPMINFKRFRKQRFVEPPEELITNLASFVEDEDANQTTRSFMVEWCQANNVQPDVVAVREVADADQVDDLWTFSTESASSPKKRNAAAGRKRVR